MTTLEKEDGRTWQKLRSRRASADELLMLFCVTTPPVDVRQIALLMGVQIFFEDDELLADTSGDLKVEGNYKAIIRVHRDHHPNRQRFTIAHELGHLMMHKVPPGGIFRENEVTGNWKEQEANGFAADLLVPLDLLEPNLRRYSYNISALSHLFNVSEVVMGIRFSKLRERMALG